MAEWAMAAADHEATAHGRLLEEWRRGPVVRALLSAISRQSEEAEAALLSLVAAFDLDDAAGAQLDMIGALFRQPRLGRADAAYRAALLTEQAILRSSGTMPDMLRVTLALRQSSAIGYGIALVRERVAAVTATLTTGAGGVASAVSDEVGRALARAAPAGVEIIVDEAESSATAFAFGDAADATSAPETDTATGWDGIADSYGGLAAHVWRAS